MMGLNLFELLMIVMFLAFLPDRVIRDRFPGPERLALAYSGFQPARGEQARPRRWPWRSISITRLLYTQIDSECRHANGCGKESRDWPRWRFVATGAVRCPAILAFLLWVPGVRGLAARYFFPRDGGRHRDSESNVAVRRAGPGARLMRLLMSLGRHRDTRASAHVGDRTRRSSVSANNP